MRIIILLMVLFFTACSSGHQNKVFTKADAIDSLYFDGLKDKRELSKLIQTNDTQITTYNYYDGEIVNYKKFGLVFEKIKQAPIENSFYFEVFCSKIGSSSMNLIGKNENEGLNYWYSIDSNGNKKLIDSIVLKLNVLKEGQYRFASSNSMPVLITDTSFCLVIGYNSPMDYAAWFNEKTIAQIIIEKQKIKSIKYLFDKPKSLNKQVLTAPFFCKNNNLILLVYPCIDSIFLYNLNTGQYSVKAIQNPHYTTPPNYDISRWQEADYFTEVNLRSFSYEGIFYNPNTFHYVLYYTPKVDEQIKTPNYDDKKHYAIVLDTNFNQIKTALFTEKYRSPASYLVTAKGIYMPLFIKNKNEENRISYYLFDL